VRDFSEQAICIYPLPIPENPTMSVTYTNELVLVGEPSELNRVLPGLIEQGWLVSARDRLCVKLKYTGGPLALPSEIARNMNLHATLSCLETGYNSIDLETSVHGFYAHSHQRGLQGVLYPRFAGQEPHDITEVTPEMALEMAEHDGEIRLAVTSISVDAARLLAGHTCPLVLTGITSLTPEVASELAKHRGPLLLDYLEDLPLEVAREFAASSATLSFGGLTRIDPRAIEVLAAGVPHPEHGAKYGKRTREYGDLRLNGLRQISPELARAIASHPRNIALNGLEELTPEVARELAVKCEGFLELRGVRSIGEAAAALLGNTSAGLILPGIRRLSRGAAAGLAQTSGGLFLNGLRFLSLEGAQALASHRGHLGLLGITQVDAAILEALAEHEGPVVLGINGGMTLDVGRWRGRGAAAWLADLYSASMSERGSGTLEDETTPVEESRHEEWRRAFRSGTMSFGNYTWLKEHVERELLGAGMSPGDAREMAVLLRDDTVGLLEARDAAQSDLNQLDHLECRDEWLRRRAERALEAAASESAG
jgi:hypothetical protein